MILLGQTTLLSHIKILKRAGFKIADALIMVGLQVNFILVNTVLK